ncbi:hypothetical protein PESP_a2293 [Pseudoalteromonas espejiana DSM 9414]|nr:hypothetical protein PESP_a2293 [Pseudoalteromonas espejiana DSM 9414]
MSNRLKHTCLCKHVIKGDFWLVEALKQKVMNYLLNASCCF